MFRVDRWPKSMPGSNRWIHLNPEGLRNYTVQEIICCMDMEAVLENVDL
jgi:hypothetical protein